MRGLENKIAIIPFSKLSKLGEDLVGLKGTNLGRLISLRIPVPNGFVVTTDVFNQHFRKHNLYDFIEKELSVIDPSDSVRLENASKRIRSGIAKFGISKELAEKIAKAYAAVSGFADAYVAVRSSMPFENKGSEMYPRELSTFLNIKGSDAVVENVKRVWTSLYTPQNLFNALSRSMNLADMKMAVIVQKMVQAEASGIMYTINPIDDDSSKVTLEAVLGLGEVLIHGEIMPDSYIIEKESGEILEKHIIPQEWMLVRKGRTKKGEDPNIKVKVSDVWRTRQKLENKYIDKLVKIGVGIEKEFGEAQNIEWVYEGGKIWIVQTRKITKLDIKEESWKETPTFEALRSKIGDSKGLSRKKTQILKPKKKDIRKEVSKTHKTTFAKKGEKKDGLQILLVGKVSMGGVVSGPVRIVKSARRLSNIQEGSIVVTPSLNFKLINKLQGIVAIITDDQDNDSYAATLAQKLGIPCVIDTQIATKVMRNGEFVTINGDTGKIFAGTSEKGLSNAERILQSRKETEVMKKEVTKKVEPIKKDQTSIVKTATKVFVSIDDPNLAPTIATGDIDGVGVVQSEFMFSKIDLHPQEALKKKRNIEETVKALTVGLYRVARSFEPRPVIYRLNDMKSTEFASLGGGSEIETVEQNPMLGLRGAGRFLTYPDEIKLEIEAIRTIRNKENVKNVWLAIPFVRTYKELRDMKKLISSFGFRRSSTFKIFMVAEVPSAVVRIEKLLDVGIDGVIVDTDDLAQLMLGVDRANPRLGEYNYSSHPALLWSLERVIKACNKYNVHSLVSSKSITSLTKVIEKLVKWGVTSISVESEEVSKVRGIIHDVEKKILVRRKR